jgi:hypothetical protein
MDLLSRPVCIVGKEGWGVARLPWKKSGAAGVSPSSNADMRRKKTAPEFECGILIQKAMHGVRLLTCIHGVFIRVVVPNMTADFSAGLDAKAMLFRSRGREPFSPSLW